MNSNDVTSSQKQKTGHETVKQNNTARGIMINYKWALRPIMIIIRNVKSNQWIALHQGCYQEKNNMNQFNETCIQETLSKSKHSLDVQNQCKFSLH